MEQRVTKPSADDLAEIEADRDWVRGHYDSDAQHKYETLQGKLVLLQAILDAGWIERSETAKLQSLGVTLGDALAQELHLEWVSVDDEYGRNPALRVPGTSVIVFPRTMISKRIERGETVNVSELFRGVCDHVRQMKRNPDYQRH